MSGIVFFLAALAFGAYAKNVGRSYLWGSVPFALMVPMQIYEEMGGGGPGGMMRTIYAFAITGLLYFISGQATIAHEQEKKKQQDQHRS